MGPTDAAERKKKFEQGLSDLSAGRLLVRSAAAALLERLDRRGTKEEQKREFARVTNSVLVQRIAEVQGCRLDWQPFDQRKYRPESGGALYPTAATHGQEHLPYLACGREGLPYMKVYMAPERGNPVVSVAQRLKDGTCKRIEKERFLLLPSREQLQGMTTEQVHLFLLQEQVLLGWATNFATYMRHLLEGAEKVCPKVTDAGDRQ